MNRKEHGWPSVSKDEGGNESEQSDGPAWSMADNKQDTLGRANLKGLEEGLCAACQCTRPERCFPHVHPLNDARRPQLVG